jgi:hypothetical protein
VQSDPSDEPLRLTLLDAMPHRETKSLSDSAVRHTAQQAEVCLQWACDQVRA